MAVGNVDDESMGALRRSLYLGEEGFKDKLLGMLEKARAKIRKRGNHSGGVVAEQIPCWLGGRTGMPIAIVELEVLLTAALEGRQRAALRNGPPNLC